MPNEEQELPAPSGFDGNGVWAWGPPESEWASARTDGPVDITSLREAIGTDDLSFNGVSPTSVGAKEIRAAIDQAALTAALDAHDPTVVVVDRERIAANGQDAATVTYRRRVDKAPVEVEFSVNGVPASVPTTSGEAEVVVRSSTPRTIEISVAGRTLYVEAR